MAARIAPTPKRRVVERLQAEQAATREHLAVTTAAVRRLLGEKEALIAYSRGLEEQLSEMHG